MPPSSRTVVNMYKFTCVILYYGYLRAWLKFGYSSRMWNVWQIEYTYVHARVGELGHLVQCVMSLLHSKHSGETLSDTSYIHKSYICG